MCGERAANLHTLARNSKIMNDLMRARASLFIEPFRRLEPHETGNRNLRPLERYSALRRTRKRSEFLVQTQIDPVAAILVA